MQNVGLNQPQAEIKIAKRNNNLRYADDTTLNGRKWRGTREPLDVGERGESQCWLKTQHSKNEDHGIHPITSWQIEGENMETVTDFIFLGSKITVDSDCSHKIKRGLLLRRKALTKRAHMCVCSCAQLCLTPCNPMDYSLPGSSLLDSITKNRDITLLTKVHKLKAIVFLIVTYWCENWTIKKTERWKIDTLELWCWRRPLRVSWTEEIKLVNPKGNQPWVFIGRTDAEVEAPILWPPDEKSQLIRKDSDARKDWRQK